MKLLLFIVVFGMRRVEGDLQAERLVGWLGAEKLDRFVGRDVGFVPLRPVRHGFHIGIAADFFAIVEHGAKVGRGDPDMHLADEAGAIACAAQLSRIGDLDEFGSQLRSAARDPVLSFAQTGPEGGAARNAHRTDHIGALEAHALAGQAIDRRRLENRMPGAAHQVVAHIVGQEENKVRPDGLIGARQVLSGAREGLNRRQQNRAKDRISSHCRAVLFA